MLLDVKINNLTNKNNYYFFTILKKNIQKSYFSNYKENKK